jgi:hypothetical protein
VLVLPAGGVAEFMAPEDMLLDAASLAGAMVLSVAAGAAAFEASTEVSAGFLAQAPRARRLTLARAKAVFEIVVMGDPSQKGEHGDNTHFRGWFQPGAPKSHSGRWIGPWTAAKVAPNASEC